MYNLSPRQLTGRTAVSFPLHTGVYATWSGGKKSFFRTPKAKDKVTKEGMVLFDDKPFFPCKALFLTATNAIVLKDVGAGRYNRVGSADFYNAKVVDVDKVAFPNGAVQQVVIV